MTHTAKPLRILLSAYACEPSKGSEPGVGWNWALALARRGHVVWVLTRNNNRQAIEQAITQSTQSEFENIKFLYYDLPKWASWWKKGGRGVHLYYLLWQRGIMSVATAAHKNYCFDLSHHISFGVWRQPSHLHKLGIPLIFGPAGGGEAGTKLLLKTLPLLDQFGEILRNSVNWLALLNPSLHSCLSKAYVVSKTSETATWVQRAGGSPHISFEIGINAKEFEIINSKNTSDEIKCLFAGRLLGWKGVHLAVMSVARAKQHGCKVKLTIVGKGPMRSALKKLTRSMDIAGQVVFIDWLTQVELFQQYQSHDVLLFPSLHDSSGNVILEAFAHGLPVVCLKLGGPGVLVDNTCGRVVDVAATSVEKVVDKLAEAIIELAESPALRKELSCAARLKAEKSTWDAAVSGIYDSISYMQN